MNNVKRTVDLVASSPVPGHFSKKAKPCIAEIAQATLADMNSQNMEKAALVSDLKSRGNLAFKDKKFSEACECYSRALELDPENSDAHILYSNRAACLLSMERYEDALKDAETVISTKPEWPKGYGRLAAALFYMKRYEESRKAYEKALELEPSNLDFKKALAEVESQLTVALALERKLKGYSDDFECVLCMKLFYEPVTTPCGHTFCRSCLRRALDHSALCPLCRSILHITSDHAISVTLAAIIEKNFPEEYKRRAAEVSSEVRQTEASMPLFVLNAVVFPAMKFPMHIFEPRYRLMLRRCLEGDKRFGLVSCRKAPDGRWVPADVGCILQITEHQGLPDGRSYIDCVGTRRFRVLEKWEQDGYLCGKIEYFEDLPLDTDEKRSEFGIAATRTRELLSQLMVGANNGVSASLQQLLGRAGDIPENDAAFGLWLAAHMPLRPDLKQDMLETRDSIARMRRLQAQLALLVGTEPPQDCRVQ